MSSLSVTLDSQLARSVRFTDRLKQRRLRSRAARRVVHGLDFLARGVFHVWRNRRYLTLRKLVNMAMVNVQFHFKTQRVIGLPYRMKIESTNICNTHCQLCPTGIGLKGRPKGKMGFEQFKALIDQLKGSLYVLDLSMWGDPLIVPDIYRMVRYAHDAGIWTYLSSNLHAFKPGKGQAEAIVESGLDMLTCSLHGASQATYELYQPGKTFAESVEKVRLLVATRDRLGSATPAIQLNFVVTRHNEHEKAAFQRLADDLGCKAVFSMPSLNVRFLGHDQNLVPLGLAEDVLAKKRLEHLRHWLPSDKTYVLDAYEQMLEGKYEAGAWNGRKAFDCAWPWQASVINWDGNVSLCCGSFHPDEDMGNVFQTPFRKVWNGRAYRLSRRSFRRPVGGGDLKTAACATCPGFMV